MANLDKWLKKVDEVESLKNMKMVVVGNKIDLIEDKADYNAFLKALK